MAKGETPEKICKGKSLSAESPNNYCRCCKTVLRILYGSTWESVSTENVFRPWGKKGIEGEILSYQLKQQQQQQQQKKTGLTMRKIDGVRVHH